MNGFVEQALFCAAVASGGVAGSFLVDCLLGRANALRRKQRALRYQANLASGEGACGEADCSGKGSAKSDLPALLLGYVQKTSQELSYRRARAWSPRVRSGRANGSHAAVFLEKHAAKAGYARIGVDGFVEVRFRLSVVGGALGALLGALFSMELMLLAFLAGAVCGWQALPRSLLSLERRRGAEAEAKVSEMLEVVALGLRSGLTFDRSFALYGEHFDSSFAQDCASACRSWALGLSTREEALRGLAASYNCEALARALDAAIRSLRFGASFVDDLEEMAAQSRASYRATVSEKVAKAPVKMMLPTGALILPAMLLLVLGPILLELAQGF